MVVVAMEVIVVVVVVVVVKSNMFEIYDMILMSVYVYNCFNLYL